MSTTVDHVGIIVQDMAAALPFYVEQLGLTVVSDEELPEVGVRVAYLAAGQTMIQLVEPIAPGRIRDDLETEGEGIHHLCLAVVDIPSTLRDLAPDTDVPIVMGGRGRRACFLPGRHGGIRIELTETEPFRAG